jgi:hypothetical protein
LRRYSFVDDEYGISSLRAHPCDHLMLADLYGGRQVGYFALLVGPMPGWRDSFFVAEFTSGNSNSKGPRIMSTLVYYLIVLATMAVCGVLLWGLSTLLRGDNPNLSQKLMRWRIGLQFIAILLIMMFVFLTRGQA